MATHPRITAWKTPQPDYSRHFVEFAEEAAQMYAEFPEELTIRRSWDFDDQERRDAFDNDYQAFRQHVLNLYDSRA